MELGKQGEREEEGSWLTVETREKSYNTTKYIYHTPLHVPHPPELSPTTKRPTMNMMGWTESDSRPAPTQITTLLSSRPYFLCRQVRFCGWNRPSVSPLPPSPSIVTWLPANQISQESSWEGTKHASNSIYRYGNIHLKGSEGDRNPGVILSMAIEGDNNGLWRTI